MNKFHFSTRPERIMEDYLQNHGIFFRRQVTFGNNTYRCDFMIERPQYLLILEIDENQHHQETDHNHYVRMNIMKTIAQGQLVAQNKVKPIVFFRLNPDRFRKGQSLCTLSLDERFTFACETIKTYQPKSSYDIVYFFYDEDQGKLTRNTAFTHGQCVIKDCDRVKLQVEDDEDNSDEDDYDNVSQMEEEDEEEEETIDESAPICVKSGCIGRVQKHLNGKYKKLCPRHLCMQRKYDHKKRNNEADSFWVLKCGKL